MLMIECSGADDPGSIPKVGATCVVTKYNVRKYKSIKLYTISDGPRVGLPKPNREDVCVPPSGLPVCESNPGKTLSYSDPQSGIGHDII